MIKIIIFFVSIVLHHQKHQSLISMPKPQYFKTICQEKFFGKDADMSIYPASMTKIMTSIVAFDLIKKGQLSLDEKLVVSENVGDLLMLDIHQCL